MSDHTPGPWTTQDAIGTSGWCYMDVDAVRSDGSKLYGIASVFAHAMSKEECQANARLIAAAPDLKADNDRLRAVNAELLEALEAMLEHSCVADAGADMKFAEDHATERRARAAIAKAKGDDHA